MEKLRHLKWSTVYKDTQQRRLVAMMFAIIYTVRLGPKTILADQDCAVEDDLISPTPVFSSNTVFLWPNLITESDKTLYTGNIATGQRMVTMYSRVLESWITVPAWTFQATFQ